jgi:hypothetical protein
VRQALSFYSVTQTSLGHFDVARVRRRIDDLMLPRRPARLDHRGADSTTTAAHARTPGSRRPMHQHSA